MKTNKEYDAIIIGSGMGGMSAGSMLANDGWKVLILEAAHVAGGCSSSYTRKGYTFESGATTLIGFDENQPLRYLEEQTGIRIPREELQPSMRISLEGEELIRYKDRDQWIDECVRVFGNRAGQESFWNLAFNVTDVVWKVSLKNPFFPPNKTSDWFRLLTSNSPLDVWVLPYALRSVKEVAAKEGVLTPEFERFLDEQLMITAQSKSSDTPFLFGAAGITYTNYSNFYVPGGLIEMVNTIQEFIESKGGAIHVKEAVTSLSKAGEDFVINTKKGKIYQSPVVISNIPVWNMAALTSGDLKAYFQQESERFNKAWGAITIGIACDDRFPADLPLHHQIHIGNGEKVPFTDSDSFFVSMSMRDDDKRAETDSRTLNISCHADPEYWFSLNGKYDDAKNEVEEFIIQQLEDKLPGFDRSGIRIKHTATPVTWEKWVYRKKGRVGGIPQSMARSLLDWTPHETPAEGLYLTGDTTYPGQGIPGVTLSGINVYWRIKRNKNKSL
ncbi:phytoene desaturase family protein [Balneola sp. MJW-20]|uniref:phytoene desaturase family protein n=1 Tax=Gracilimonas aurantiaca TaxID=3234185 RepID=UPI003466ABE1